MLHSTQKFHVSSSRSQLPSAAVSVMQLCAGIEAATGGVRYCGDSWQPPHAVTSCFRSQHPAAAPGHVPGARHGRSPHSKSPDAYTHHHSSPPESTAWRSMAKHLMAHTVAVDCTALRSNVAGDQFATLFHASQRTNVVCRRVSGPAAAASGSKGSTGAHLTSGCVSVESTCIRQHALSYRKQQDYTS